MNFTNFYTYNYILYTYIYIFVSFCIDSLLVFFGGKHVAIRVIFAEFICMSLLNLSFKVALLDDPKEACDSSPVFVFVVLSN